MSPPASTSSRRSGWLTASHAHSSWVSSQYQSGLFSESGWVSRLLAAEIGYTHIFKVVLTLLKIVQQDIDLLHEMFKNYHILFCWIIFKFLVKIKGGVLSERWRWPLWRVQNEFAMLAYGSFVAALAAAHSDIVLDLINIILIYSSHVLLALYKQLLSFFISLLLLWVTIVRDLSQNLDIILN